MVVPIHSIEAKLNVRNFRSDGADSCVRPAGVIPHRLLRRRRSWRRSVCRSRGIVAEDTAVRFLADLGDLGFYGAATISENDGAVCFKALIALTGSVSFWSMKSAIERKNRGMEVP